MCYSLSLKRALRMRGHLAASVACSEIRVAKSSSHSCPVPVLAKMTNPTQTSRHNPKNPSRIQSQRRRFLTGGGPRLDIRQSSSTLASSLVGAGAKTGSGAGDADSALVAGGGVATNGAPQLLQKRSAASFS